jgi:hypothetical protein
MSRDDIKADEFQIDGVGFRLKPLPVIVAEKLAPAVTELVTPALAALFAGGKDIAQLGQSLRGLSGCAEQLPRLREAFAAQCSVTIGEAPGVGKAGPEIIWSELKGKVLDDTFRRKHKLYFEWLGNCLALEYGDFLAEIGQRLIAALKANPSAFPTGFPGESGDSPQTQESKTD